MFSYARAYARHRIEDARRSLGFRQTSGRGRVLVVQAEGIGNAILTTPLISALALLEPQPEVDIVVDARRGTQVLFEGWPAVTRVIDAEAASVFGGPFHYEHVLECHPRKGLPKDLYYRKRWSLNPPGDSSLDYHWRFPRHESEMLLDYARALGYRGPSPPVRPCPKILGGVQQPAGKAVAIGIGYYKGRRADGRDWSDRHWGNDRFLKLCRLLIREGYEPVIVGTADDLSLTRFPLRESGASSVCGRYDLPRMAGFLSKCGAFVGNDTGLMHVAASLDLPTVGVFVSTNSVKSYPLGRRTIALGGDRGPRKYDIGVDEVYAELRKLMAMPLEEGPA